MHAIDNEDGIIQIKSFRSKEQGGEREREREETEGIRRRVVASPITQRLRNLRSRCCCREAIKIQNDRLWKWSRGRRQAWLRHRYISSAAAGGELPRRRKHIVSIFLYDMYINILEKATNEEEKFLSAIAHGFGWMIFRACQLWGRRTEGAREKRVRGEKKKK